MLDEEVLVKALQDFLHALMARRVRQLEDHQEGGGRSGHKQVGVTQDEPINSMP